MSRNGCKKILIANGHGGNNNLLPYFAQSQLATPHDYVVYVSLRPPTPPNRPAQTTKNDGHAGESETSRTEISRPDLVHLDPAATQSGTDLNHLDLPTGIYTGIWWYAKFPERYAGEGAAATQALGEFDSKAAADYIATAIRAIKSDRVSPRLQEEFFSKTIQPAQTQQ